MFIDLESEYALNTSWEFFMGYRYGIFNFAMIELGGSVLLKLFDLLF